MVSTQATNQPPDAAPNMVLVVDDDAGLRFLISEALEQAGFAVIEAEDGRHGVAAYREHRPDVVLLDVMMPFLDGFAACMELRGLPEAEHLPILMMTGLEDDDSVNRAYDAGATDFITKPINYALLGHRVRYMLRASQTTNQLVRSERRLATAQRIARLGYWEWDTESGVVTCSDGTQRILGLPEVGSLESISSLLAHVAASDQYRVQEWFLRAATEGYTGDISHGFVGADGKERYLRQQVEPLLDDSGQVARLYGTVQDISEMRMAEQRIHRLAYFDGLTGLPNREFFKETVRLAARLAERHGRQGALLFLDLDNFKRINDTLGHNIGDMLLKSVAERLIGSMRTTDLVTSGSPMEPGHNLARLGGDEFTILLPEIRQTSDAAVVATRILEVLSRTVILADHDVVVTPSIGITVFPKDGVDVDHLLRNSDIAMYHAKREGKNTFRFYDNAMNEAAQKRLRMENALRNALVREEFSLHYQPQVDMVTGKVCAMEALLRWRSEDMGSVSPADFIPLAEETGLIVPMGEWVLRTACRQAKAWLDTGSPVDRIAVNVSVKQFVQQGFPDTVRSVLDETGLDPGALELEVTESLLMKDADGAIATLKALKAIGVQLAIDDFGTGYSSLSYLKQLPIDRLKIDRAFVHDVNSDRDNAAIATAVIAMAYSMNLKVTAEGVETDAQLGFLRAKKCNEAQGFLLCPPLPADEVERYLLQARNAAAALPMESGNTVLLVGDDRDTLDGLKDAIGADGYHVVTARSAHEGLDQLAKHQVGVVVSNYRMPEMDGNRFFSIVRKLYPDSKRIMISGESDLKSMVASINEGAVCHFLQRPISTKEFREVVRNAFLSLDKSD